MLIKTLHITLIFSLLASSVGVVVNQHFCRDELKRISFFTAVESCHGTPEEQRPACPYHSTSDPSDGIDRKDCCDNSSHYLKSAHEQQVEQEGDFPFFKALISGNYSPFPILPNRFGPPALSGKLYRPPPLAEDLSVQFQNFRL